MKPSIPFSTLETVERRQILRALRLTNGNLSQAALLLDIDRRTLYRKLEKYNRARRNAVATISYVGGRTDSPGIPVLDAVNEYPEYSKE